MLRKKRFLIGGIVIVIAIVYLGFIGFQGSATYYYTVSEFVAQGSSTYDENVRVNGVVVPGSVEQEPVERLLRFTVIDAEEGASLPVVYQGVVPDTFREDYEIVAEGYLSSDGVFQAHILMVKCPAKYESQE